ncbi:MAG: ABC transporter ATP-binding protein [Proteobacteria bacterium]|nr:ABC transporter ATP-binding protein [Pseudomonadota bacterium]
MSSPVLDVRKLTMDFGGIRALDCVDLDVNAGEIVALIGPNGAGKTTFFNCITGIYAPSSGEVLVEPMGQLQRRINGYKPNKVTELGMARTFQNIRLFPDMTVLENVMIGRHIRNKSSILGAVLQTRHTREQERLVVEKSYEMLELVGLTGFANELSSNLPYGEQRRLEIARAMATEPFLLLLDEPAAGMNPQETQALEALVDRIRQKLQIAILLIEHDMKMVMSVSDRVFVMEYGQRIATGKPEEVSKNPDVIRAYLGEDEDD